MTRLLLLIGDPVHHSLSPRLHNAAIQELGIPYIYAACRVRTGDVGEAIQGIRALGVAGANVTIPHKESVIPYLDELTPTAAAIGAVNTIYWKEDALVGDNTDVEGFIRPIANLERGLRSVLVIGSGGAARAVLYGLRNVPNLIVASRSTEKALRMVEEMAIQADVIELDDAADRAASSQLIVNATPVGGPGLERRVPIQLSTLQPGTIVYDLLYAPSPSRFLSNAQALGGSILDGRRMLREQASAAFKRWTGHRFPDSVQLD